jgi:hypothetical protein
MKNEKKKLGCHSAMFPRQKKKRGKNEAKITMQIIIIFFI